jgi:putative glutathione S-transferase
MSRYASAVDPATFGDYRIIRPPGDDRPLYRFSDRIVAGEPGLPQPRFASEPNRYHVYAGWFCPWSQRVTIQIAINGLSDVIGISYVDNERDGRGWAFRRPNGPDPVNGFTLLRDAYEATERGFDGHVSTPTLWDRRTGRVVSNTYTTVGLDIATQFRAYGDDSVDTYPEPLQREINQLDTWIGPAVNQGVSLASADSPEGRDARARLLRVFAALDERLAVQRYLLGDSITEADIRLFVTLVRYDAQANARQEINEGLGEFPHLWEYARDLYSQPAFSSTTDFASFTRPGVQLPDWEEPTDRAGLSRRAA